MVANDKLKKYAEKIYNGKIDYSLQKAYRLFPKYFIKIAFYYTEMVVQKQEEITRRTMQELGYIKAAELRDEAAAAHREIKKYRNKILKELEVTDINEQIFDSENDMYLYGEELRLRKLKILEDLRKKIILNREALRTVERTAQKYRYNDIFREAATYEIKNEEIFWQVAYALRDSREATERYYQDYESTEI